MGGLYPTNYDDAINHVSAHFVVGGLYPTYYDESMSNVYAHLR